MNKLIPPGLRVDDQKMLTVDKFTLLIDRAYPNDALLHAFHHCLSDIHVTEEHYEIMIELPRFQRDNITVEVPPNFDNLIITAKRPDKYDESSQGLVRFRRKDEHLPFSIEGDANIRADYNNSYLSIYIPRVKSAISVNVD